jgi:hypothetical protein
MWTRHCMVNCDVETNVALQNTKLVCLTIAFNAVGEVHFQVHGDYTLRNVEKPII